MYSESSNVSVTWLLGYSFILLHVSILSKKIVMSEMSMNKYISIPTYPLFSQIVFILFY